MQKDLVAIVTGSSRGLGRVMAEAIIAAGGRAVITAAKSPDELRATAAEITAKYGDGKILALPADVTDETDCQRIIASTLSTFGRIDALINNAGRGMRTISETYHTDMVGFWEITPEQWDLVFDTNVGGTFRMSRAVMPHFLAQKSGRIVNISTSDTTMIRKGYAPYGPTKAAIEAMSRSWAESLVGTGITVNILLPGGAVATSFVPGGANLLDAAIMGPPAAWLVSEASAAHTGERFIAKLWDPSLPVAEAVAASRDAPVVGKR